MNNNNNNNNSQIISIVSGKGGSGKSLLTAILGRALAREGIKVLLIDLDIFVRGLTILLREFDQSKRQGNVTVSDILGIYDHESADSPPKSIQGLDIRRFYECDVLPAVANLNDPLDYDDRELSDEQFVRRQLEKLLEKVRGNYDIILLDNRAGMDSIIFSSCILSDFILSIAEDDQVGKLTNTNIINYLKFNKRVRNIYTIINKGRHIKDYKDLQKMNQREAGFNVSGIIPFDMEVMQDFGTERFWGTVNETLYFKAVIEAWNNLAKSEHVKEISEGKYRFPSKIFMSKRQGKFTTLERVLRIYSIILISIGMFLWFYRSFRFMEISTFDLISILTVLIGFLTLILSTSNIRYWLVGKRDDE